MLACLLRKGIGSCWGNQNALSKFLYLFWYCNRCWSFLRWKSHRRELFITLILEISSGRAHVDQFSERKKPPGLASISKRSVSFDLSSRGNASGSGMQPKHQTINTLEGDATGLPPSNRIKWLRRCNILRRCDRL